jgi:hypothetical protein
MQSACYKQMRSILSGSVQNYQTRIANLKMKPEPFPENGGTPRWPEIKI